MLMLLLLLLWLIRLLLLLLLLLLLRGLLLQVVDGDGDNVQHLRGTVDQIQVLPQSQMKPVCSGLPVATGSAGGFHVLSNMNVQFVFKHRHCVKQVASLT